MGSVTPLNRSAPPLQLTTLGEVSLVRLEPGRDAEILLGPGKPIALVTYLALSPGRRASREHLLGLLWADLPLKAARHALRQMVWYIRQRVGDDTLRTENGELVLQLELGVDRDEFLAAVDRVDLESAVALYTGEFLPDLALPGGAEFEHWADLERYRLRLVFTRTAEAVVRRWLTAGRQRDAQHLARRVRDMDPLAEPGWRLLLESLVSSGDALTARIEADALRDLLREEGREPDPATKRLLSLARTPGQAIREDEAGRTDGRLVAELVGREMQFATLVRAWERVRSGNAVHLHVTAPAGLGKTRLLDEASHRLRAIGAPVVHVRANPGEHGVAFALAGDLAEALGELPGAKAVSPDAATELVGLSPSLSARFLAAARTSDRQEVLRRRTMALAELVAALADERPLALLIDDVHWADAESRQVVKGLVARADAAQCLIVTTTRPMAEGQVGRHGTVAIELPPLEADHVGTLLSSLGTLPAQPFWLEELPLRLCRTTGGSPLLLLETLRLALEQGMLTLDKNGWHCDDDDRLRAELERGGALRHRVESLGPDERWQLLLLAVAGVPLETGALERMSGLSTGAVEELLRGLELRGLVAHIDHMWMAGHDEVADLARDLATSEALTAAHATLGRMLAQRDDREPQRYRQAARHLAAAGLQEDLRVMATRWIRRARRAGDRRSVRALLAELLGTSEHEPPLQDLLRSLPMNLRHRPLTRLAAVGFGLVAIVTIIVALAPRGESDTSPAIAIWKQAPSGEWRLHAKRLTGDDIGRGIVSLASLEPTDFVVAHRSNVVAHLGSPNRVAAAHPYSDSGGLDIKLVTAGGSRPTRLTSTAGDDLPGSWSPDGRYLVIMTDRWSNRSRSDLAIIDAADDGSVVRRLTSTEARDINPRWSPDGTRVAFSRHGSGEHPSALCVVSVDGVEERCHVPQGYMSAALIGWVDAIRVAGSLIDRSGSSQIVTLDSETGEHRVLAEGRPTGFSSVAGWVVCFCRRSPAEPFQTLLLPLDDPDRAVRVEPGDPPPSLHLYPSGDARTYLQRVRIQGADSPIPVDAAFKLALEGQAADGTPIRPLAVRWTSADTTVATVDSVGVVRPRRRGDVIVRATAGGWREDSVRLRIGPAQTRTVLAEEWRDGIGDRWVSFGTPEPYVTMSDRGPALAPNGDSAFVSGVYLRERLPVGEGIGLEFEVQTPLTRLEWQKIAVWLGSADSLNLGSWDHGVGRLEIPNRTWTGCGIEYPAFEMELGKERLSLEAGIKRFLPVPHSMPVGEWTRLRLQLFPDGRCGLALNGEPRVILDHRLPPADSAMLLVHSRSHGTTILFGPIEAWLGVRRDVDWEAVEGR